MTDEECIALGYSEPRLMPNGCRCALAKMMFTTALIVGITPLGYGFRYCYEHYHDASDALKAWDGTGDPPGLWIKKKGLGEDKLGPGAA